MRVDLHMHSTHSDGEYTPRELVEEARYHNVSIMAITDHDEVSAIQEAQLYANQCGIKLISGIECNTDGELGELHILGYGFDPLNERMQEYIRWRQQERALWSRRIIEKLQKQGFHIGWADCWKRASEKVIVRTHIADELVAKGYFSDSHLAFQSLLAKGASAFVKREGLSAIEAIELIHLAGGKAVLAHPGRYEWRWSLNPLVAAGLDGIEVYYSTHSVEDTIYWGSLADRYNLFKSTGSDFHGPTSRSPYPIGSVAYNESDVLSWVKEFAVKEGVH